MLPAIVHNNFNEFISVFKKVVLFDKNKRKISIQSTTNFAQKRKFYRLFLKINFFRKQFLSFFLE